MAGLGIAFTVNDKGAQKLKRLTGMNLPGPDGTSRSLGTIVDDQLVNAATIRDAFSTSAELTGDFTNAQVDDLVAKIGSGELPAELRFVGETETEHAK